MDSVNYKIPGWKYYNHAAIPTTAPHEEPNLTPIKNGSIWKIEGKKPLFVRYTTNWDCGYDTGWWFIIKDSPFDIETLSKNSRKHIKAAFRKVRIEKINPVDFVEALYECYHQAFLKYKLADNELPYEQFKKACEKVPKQGVSFFAGFSIEANQLIGYAKVQENDKWAEIVTAKFDPRFLNLHVSDALYATILENYLNKLGMSYVSSGARSINHETNTQEYKESHFGYRKCYCKLNVVCRPSIKMVLAVLYPFRQMITLLGRRVRLLHQLSAILKMVEIVKKVDG